MQKEYKEKLSDGRVKCKLCQNDILSKNWAMHCKSQKHIKNKNLNPNPNPNMYRLPLPIHSPRELPNQQNYLGVNLENMYNPIISTITNQPFELSSPPNPRELPMPPKEWISKLPPTPDQTPLDPNIQKLEMPHPPKEFQFQMPKTFIENNKDYKICSMCEIKVLASNFSKHMKKHHPDSDYHRMKNEKVLPNSKQCEVCKTFISATNFSRHMKSKHPGIEYNPYEKVACSTCKQMISKGQLHNHICKPKDIKRTGIKGTKVDPAFIDKEQQLRWAQFLKTFPGLYWFYPTDTFKSGSNFNKKDVNAWNDFYDNEVKNFKPPKLGKQSLDSKNNLFNFQPPPQPCKPPKIYGLQPSTPPPQEPKLPPDSQPLVSQQIKKDIYDKEGNLIEVRIFENDINKIIKLDNGKVISEEYFDRFDKIFERVTGNKDKINIEKFDKNGKLTEIKIIDRKNNNKIIDKKIYDDKTDSFVSILPKPIPPPSEEEMIAFEDLRQQILKIKEQRETSNIPQKSKSLYSEEMNQNQFNTKLDSNYSFSEPEEFPEEPYSETDLEIQDILKFD